MNSRPIPRPFVRVYNNDNNSRLLRYPFTTQEHATLKAEYRHVLHKSWHCVNQDYDCWKIPEQITVNQDDDALRVNQRMDFVSTTNCVCVFVCVCVCVSVCVFVYFMVYDDISISKFVITFCA